jgi:thiol-disulfide isomerase/thioredoxin
MQTEHFFVPGADGVQRLKEPLILKPGNTVRLRILNEFGQPVEGAWAECSTGIFRIARTDAEGYCTFRDMPEGKFSVRFSYGDEGVTQEVVCSSKALLNEPIIVRLTRESAAAVGSRMNSHAPKIGDVAPEWSIREWSDGKDRTLASLLGRVVIIDFWWLGCAPCRQITLPVENTLRARFANQVEFVHIHPAGEEMHLIKELLGVEKWNLLAGSDNGKSATESETLNRYGVRGFPTEIIVDRQGRIAYHSGAGSDDREEQAAAMKALAEAIGLPWPIEKDADQAEISRRLRKLHEHSMTREIEKILAKQ